MSSWCKAYSGAYYVASAGTQTHTHTHTCTIIVGTLNDKYICLHLTGNTQPKPNSNNNLKATKCPLKTSPIFHFASWNVFSGPHYVQKQTGERRGGEHERVDVTSLPIILYTFSALVRMPIRHPLVQHTACRPSANYLWYIPTIFLTYIYDDMFLCGVYYMCCM